MIVGEAPGRNEDLNGRPFIGLAGAELENYLYSVGLRREDVFIDNIVHCRPSGSDVHQDWRPSPQHIATCTGLNLEPVLWMVRPKVVLALGGTACEYFLSSKVNVGEISAMPRRPAEVDGL